MDVEAEAKTAPAMDVEAETAPALNIYAEADPDPPTPYD